MEQHGLLHSPADVWCYTEFLRQEAGLTDDPPIDLASIYQQFGIPTPLRVPLVDQQGILLDGESGLILIKEDDSTVRQRFTEGHELLELLFDAATQRSLHSNVPLFWDEPTKERLCDQGAAELLMPRSSFQPKLEELGLSLQTGRALAALYQTSLQSTLIRMVQQSAMAVALILWQRAVSQSDPQLKWRVRWRICSEQWQSGFIPRNKSIAANSLIARVSTRGQAVTGIEAIDFGSGPRLYQVEAAPLGNTVLSLLQPIGRG